MTRSLGLIETQGLVAAIVAADTMLKTADVTLAGRELADAGLVTIKILGDTASVIAAVEAAAEIVPTVGILVSMHVILRPDEGLAVMLPEIVEEKVPAPVITKEKTPAAKILKEKLPVPEAVKEKASIPKIEEVRISAPAITVEKNSAVKVVNEKLPVPEAEAEKTSISEIAEEKNSAPVKDEKILPAAGEKKEKNPVKNIITTEKQKPDLQKKSEVKEKKQAKKVKQVRNASFIDEPQASLFDVPNDTIARLREEALGVETHQDEKVPAPPEKVDNEPVKAAAGTKSGNGIKDINLEELDVHSLRRLARSTEGFPIQGRQISKANRKQLIEYFKNLV